MTGTATIVDSTVGNGITLTCQLDPPLGDVTHIAVSMHDIRVGIDEVAQYAKTIDNYLLEDAMELVRHDAGPTTMIFACTPSGELIWDADGSPRILTEFDGWNFPPVLTELGYTLKDRGSHESPIGE